MWITAGSVRRGSAAPVREPLLSAVEPVGKLDGSLIGESERINEERFD